MEGKTKKHISLLLFVLIVGSFFVLQPAQAANSDIIINEIGAFPTSTHEWVEIYNKGSEPVDLTGWKFWEGNTNHGLTATGTSDSIVAPGEYAAIAQNAGVFMADHPTFPGSIFASSWSILTESGEEIGLKDAAGNFVEQFTYLTAPDHSLERKNSALVDYTSANWQEHASGDTLGSQNSAGGGAPPLAPPANNSAPTGKAYGPTGSEALFLWSKIKINEIMVDPGGGAEWIELYNPSGTNLDLTGGTICDGRTASSCVIATLGGSIPAFGWKVITLTTDRLNNSGDTVILKDFNGTIVDEVKSEKTLLPKTGQSLARLVDGIDTNSANADWAVTTQPTAGSSNVIIAPPVNTPKKDDTLPVTNPANNNVSASSSSNTVASETAGAVDIIWKIISPHSAAPGDIVDFDAAGSADPRGGRLNFRWDFGNGEIRTGAEASHLFATSGVYTILVSAMSTAGTTGEKKLTLTVAPGLSQNSRDVVISEIFPNPTGPDTSEFIELYNSSATATDISLWQIKLKSNKIFTLPDKTTIPARDTLVFYRLVTRLALNNNGDTVELFSAQNTTVDTSEYLKSIDGQSYTRGAAGWFWTPQVSPGQFDPGLKIYQTTSSLLTKINANNKITANQSIRLPATINGRPKGSAIKVSGVVSAGPGTFSDHSFYVHDDSGGIQIYAAKKIFPALLPGDKVAIAGSVSELKGIPRVLVRRPEDVDILSTEGELSPETITLEDLDDSLIHNLVTIQGEITKLTSQRMYLDDGSGEIAVIFKPAAHVSRELLAVGSRVAITGILAKPESGWQLWPRGTSDIKILGSSAEEIKTQAALAAEKNRQTKIKYTVATVSGVALIVAAWFIKKNTKLFK